MIFSRDLAPEQRSDRVIAEAWDVTFALVEGEVENSLLEQMAANVPLQEAGRQHPRVFVISRANKSLRNFSQFVGALAAGQQPDPAWLTAVGYLYRTTAVYGNGKFGIADFARLERTPAHQALYEDLIIWAREHCSLEAQELINTMLIELYPELVDSLDDELGCQESMDLQPDMKARQLKDLINQKFDWALSYREDCADDNYWFWYRSVEKEEPRLGIRGSESGAEKETALAIGPRISRCHTKLERFLERNPNAMVKSAQTSGIGT